MWRPKNMGKILNNPFLNQSTGTSEPWELKAVLRIPNLYISEGPHVRGEGGAPLITEGPTF